jgi:hypothetical protein
MGNDASTHSSEEEENNSEGGGESSDSDKYWSESEEEDGKKPPKTVKQKFTDLVERSNRAKARYDAAAKRNKTSAVATIRGGKRRASPANKVVKKKVKYTGGRPPSTQPREEKKVSKKYAYN